MKKIIAVALAALFVLSFAASAFAIHAEIPAETQAVVAKGSTQITLDGEIRVRGWWRHNLTTGNANSLYSGHPAFALGAIPTDQTNSDAWYDQRVRLGVTANVSPNLTGRILLETSGDSFDRTNDKYTWGQGIGKSGFSNAKPQSDMAILEAWIQYTGSGLFGFPAGIKIGHMPLALSHKLFFDHTQLGDDAIVFFMDPTKAVHIGLLTIKLAETPSTKTDNTDDVDAYVALVNYKINDKHTVGANWTYINASDGLNGSDDVGVKAHNVGLWGQGSIGNFGYKAELDVQFGHIDNGSVTDEKQKLRGWGLLLAGNYKMDPVNIRGSFMYGSGDNDADDNKIKEFVPFVGNVQNFSFIYEYQHMTTAANLSGMNQAAPANGHAAGIANSMIFNLGLDYSINKDMMLSADGYLFRAAKSGAVEDISGNNVSKNAGWEIDAKFKYNVARNLTYQIDAGYYKPGKFFDDAYGTDGFDLVDNARKGVTALRHSLTLSF